MKREGFVKPFVSRLLVRAFCGDFSDGVNAVRLSKYVSGLLIKWQGVFVALLCFARIGLKLR
ncbi:MAG: hypothetical protein K0S06_2824 [Microvirga sp.]|jgi:hypothetical protein|nr:hypothetical protein [Microvirga sp.]